MGVVTEGLEHALDVGMDESVVHHFILPAAKLRARRQLAIDEQEGRLKKVALLDQLLNGIASVAQDAFLAVDVCDFALDHSGIHVSRVIYPESLRRFIFCPILLRYSFDLLDISGLDRVVLDGKLIALSGAVINHSQRLTRLGFLCDCHHLVCEVLERRRRSRVSAKLSQ